MQTEPLPKKKRKVWPIILGLFVVAFFISRLTTKEKAEVPKATLEANAKQKDTNRADALVAVLKERKVKDAAITEANVLYAQIVDDRTNRNGYAIYLCQLLNDHQAEVDRVKLVAVGSQKSKNRDNAYGRLLGECNCKDYTTPAN